MGGGSAGCVLANRLSARSANRVLLCEAGQDTPPGRVPEVILDSYPGACYVNPDFFWPDLKVTMHATSHNAPLAEDQPRFKYEQARVLGGGSSINGQAANRGAPDDYDEWVTRGARGWGWQDVLPYFRKLERDMDFDGPYHGKDGRIPVSRVFPELWNGHAKGVAAALSAAGFEYLPDQNGEFREGYFPVTSSNVYERRVSSAIGYLDSATRARPNLRIATQARVTQLLFEGTRCIGVEARIDGKPETLRGGEVIVSAGALHSPVHLLRAGIGPAMALKELGIEILANRPGVGQRLMDHASIMVSSFLKPEARINDLTRRHLLLAFRYSSEIGGALRNDMYVAVCSKSAWHAVGEQIASMIIFVNRPFSEAGEVRLASSDWRDEPSVRINLLSDSRDVDRLMHALRRIASLHERPELRAVTSEVFAAVYSNKVRQVGQINARNRALTRVLAKLLDGPAPLRRFLMNRLILEAPPLEVLMRDDEALERFVRGAAVGLWHASCSCRMGGADDRMAVTDSEGRVYGVTGLRVVDASIFPVLPRANTNFPTMMVAEKISDSILKAA